MKRYFAIALLVCGCGGGDTLSRDDANTAYASTSQALNSVQVTAEGSAENGTVSATATCSEGGSASVDGTWSDGASFSLDVLLIGCTENGVTMDGELHLAATAGPGGASVSAVGSITYTGAVDGTCDLDFATEAGPNGASVRGNICGQSLDVSASL